MSEADVQMWNQVKNKIEDRDVKGVNKLLRVDPGEIELIVRTCPLYPDGCNPIAEISVSNAANRPLTIFEPRVQRLTGASYQHQNCMQDDYNVECTISTATRWCRVLKPGQTLALPPTTLTVDASGTHQVNFTLTCQLYESISERTARSTCPVVARTTSRFELIGDRPALQCGTSSIQSSNGVVTHVVEKGQDLQVISMMYGIDIVTLKVANGLKNTRLEPGQKLRVPMENEREPNKPSEATR